ncbi:MAG TPA: ribonuclease HI family protein, partial [Candidatus Woesebacteria bacterium]|nr:ribonuclease HI family protein [Candidatus Woesebacteria bacterium]
LTIHTDGGSLNNPGKAACAFLIHANGNLLHKYNEYIGIASNNVAEYTALIRALEYVKNNLLRHSERSEESHKDNKSQRDPSALPQDDIKSIHVFADSELMIRQVTGVYKVKNADIKPLHTKIKMLEMEIGIPILYTHVLREKNSEADALVKAALGR